MSTAVTCLPISIMPFVANGRRTWDGFHVDCAPATTTRAPDRRKSATFSLPESFQAQFNHSVPAIRMFPTMTHIVLLLCLSINCCRVRHRTPQNRQNRPPTLPCRLPDSCTQLLLLKPRASSCRYLSLGHAMSIHRTVYLAPFLNCHQENHGLGTRQDSQREAGTKIR